MNEQLQKILDSGRREFGPLVLDMQFGFGPSKASQLIREAQKAGYVEQTGVGSYRFTDKAYG